MRYFLFLFMSVTFVTTCDAQQLQVKTVNGIVEGLDESGIHAFKGIPYAAPPVGELRWKEPQPARNWAGVRKTIKFGPRAMQRALFGDMQFRSSGMSEDCLYLNVWTPAKGANEKLPVLVYFYGGGLMAGDGSEPRYDGESMARNGVIVITVNYRLNIFGFFNHPELSKESPHHASGNYGLLDQVAALKWVQQNIAAFGGDPARVTIAGESAGSFSVSAQMISPLAKGTFAGAIGESGAILGNNAVAPLAEAEQKGVAFGDSIGARTLAELREMSPQELLAATSKEWYSRFPITIDGYFLTELPEKTYTEGKQAHVPLLAGWNSAEMDYHALMGQDSLTKDNYTKTVQKLYGDKATDILNLYPADADTAVAQAATDLASDRFIAFGTWKWTDLHAKTGGKPVYRYLYCRARPDMRAEMGNAVPGLAGGVIKTDAPIKKIIPMGASHSSEIEYAMGNLPTNRVYDWQPEDYKVSEIMQAMFANFIKTGNPNGTGSSQWPAVKSGVPAPVMNIDVHSKAAVEEHRERYLFISKSKLM